jgi:hypothetical protein
LILFHRHQQNGAAHLLLLQVLTDVSFPLQINTKITAVQAHKSQVPDPSVWSNMMYQLGSRVANNTSGMAVLLLLSYAEQARLLCARVGFSGQYAEGFKQYF